MLSYYWQERYDIYTCFVWLGLSHVMQPILYQSLAAKIKSFVWLGLSHVMQPSLITKTSNLPPFIEALGPSLCFCRIQCYIHNKMIWKKLAYFEHSTRLAHHLLDLDIWSLGDEIWSFQWGSIPALFWSTWSSSPFPISLKAFVNLDFAWALSPDSLPKRTWSGLDLEAKPKTIIQAQSKAK